MKTIFSILVLILISVFAFCQDIGDILDEDGNLILKASSSTTYSQIKSSLKEGENIEIKYEKDSIIYVNGDIGLFYCFDKRDYLIDCYYIFTADISSWFTHYFELFSDEQGRPNTDTKKRDAGESIEFWWEDRMISIVFDIEDGNFLMVRRHFDSGRIEYTLEESRA